MFGTKGESRSGEGSRLFKTHYRLILASGSPRRREFFRDLGLDFEVLTTDVDEALGENEAPEDFVKRISLAKALVVAESTPDSWVVGADTVVVFNGRILGKPANSAEALKVLTMLNGRWHEVWTGFAVCCESKMVRVQRAVKTEVLFCQNSKELLQTYVASGAPLDKAGGYGIQDAGGVLVKKIQGSYSNVVGLPSAEVVDSLVHHGVIQPVLM